MVLLWEISGRLLSRCHRQTLLVIILQHSDFNIGSETKKSKSFDIFQQCLASYEQEIQLGCSGDVGDANAGLRVPRMHCILLYDPSAFRSSLCSDRRWTMRWQVKFEPEIWTGSKNVYLNTYYKNGSARCSGWIFFFFNWKSNLNRIRIRIRIEFVYIQGICFGDWRLNSEDKRIKQKTNGSSYGKKK